MNNMRSEVSFRKNLFFMQRNDAIRSIFTRTGKMFSDKRKFTIFVIGIQVYLLWPFIPVASIYLIHVLIHCSSTDRKIKCLISGICFYHAFNYFDTAWKVIAIINSINLLVYSNVLTCSNRCLFYQTLAFILFI